MAESWFQFTDFFFFFPSQKRCMSQAFSFFVLFCFFAYTLYFRTVAFSCYLHVCCILHYFEWSVRLLGHPCVVFTATLLQKTGILTLSPAFRRQIPTAPLFLHFDIYFMIIWLMMNWSFGLYLELVETLRIYSDILAQGRAGLGSGAVLQIHSWLVDLFWLKGFSELLNLWTTMLCFLRKASGCPSVFLTCGCWQSR